MDNKHESYVCLEVAKLLKEKGFDWDDSPFSSKQEKDEWIQNNSYSISNPNYNEDIPFDSETITMVALHISFQKAMKWLRINHNLYISLLPVVTDDDGDGGCLWNYTVVSKLKPLYKSEILYESLETAVNDAIKYCLEHLIHKKNLNTLLIT